jgi:hypothetical protein
MTSEQNPQTVGLTRIMESIFLCSYNYLGEAKNVTAAIQHGITHIAVGQILNIDTEL